MLFSCLVLIKGIIWIWFSVFWQISFVFTDVQQVEIQTFFYISSLIMLWKVCSKQGDHNWCLVQVVCGLGCQIWIIQHIQTLKVPCADLPLQVMNTNEGLGQSNINARNPRWDSHSTLNYQYAFCPVICSSTTGNRWYSPKVPLDPWGAIPGFQASQGLCRLFSASFVPCNFCAVARSLTACVTDHSV